MGGAGNTSQVPLSAVARVEERHTRLVINHAGQFPAVTLSFNLGQGASLGDAVTAIETAQREIGMPASIQTRFQGAAEAFRASLDSTLLLILAAVVTMYIVLGVLYESYIHPITILSTLPSAGVGALLALLVMGRDLSLIAIIGIILLIGIVKKNAIMMIDFALDAERNEGMSPRDAIYQAALLRFRPILMTTLAALFGALPLMFSTGTGAELRQPLGLVMVGGLLVSQVLTLFTTPVIYLFFDRLGRRWFASRSQLWWRRTRPHEPLVALHQASRRDHAAEHLGGAGRRGRVHDAAGLAAAADRLPGDLRQRGPARREPGDDGLDGGDAARTRARHDRRRQRDPLGQLAGLDPRQHPVRSRQGHQQRRARSAGGDQRVAVAAAERAARHAELPQDQSVAGADHDSGAHVGYRDAPASSTISPPRCSRRKSVR